jgi:hypothetical protein
MLIVMLFTVTLIVALLKSLRAKNSFSHPVRARAGPSSRALAGSRCLVDLVSVVEVPMPVFTPFHSIFRFPQSWLKRTVVSLDRHVGQRRRFNAFCVSYGRRPFRRAFCDREGLTGVCGQMGELLGIGHDVDRPDAPFARVEGQNGVWPPVQIAHDPGFAVDLHDLLNNVL